MKLARKSPTGLLVRLTRKSHTGGLAKLPGGCEILGFLDTTDQHTIGARRKALETRRGAPVICSVPPAPSIDKC